MYVLEFELDGSLRYIATEDPDELERMSDEELLAEADRQDNAYRHAQMQLSNLDDLRRSQ